MLDLLSRPASATFALLLLSNATPLERVIDLRARYERESNPVHRAKLIPKLGEAEISLAREQAAAGKFTDALATVTQYRDRAREVHGALLRSVADPERHASGFRELQISLRETAERMNDLEFSMPLAERPPFEDVRRDIEVLDQQVMRELFPRRTPPAPKG